MNMRSKENFGRGKTLTDADRSLLVGVQELLPGKQDGKSSCTFIRVQFCRLSPAFGSASQIIRIKEDHGRESSEPSSFGDRRKDRIRDSNLEGLLLFEPSFTQKVG
ncbi:MAG: hypothetical protein LAP85_19890 [Acidobacteriia bacterium]|nr:hypothetical protein [Terriglobia bacterium]